MEIITMIALIGGSLGFVIWSMLRKFGIGMSGGKPDCGCNSGKKCRTKRHAK